MIEQRFDLDARITSAQASVDRVRALMTKAQNLGEVVSLESELSRREGDLESLKAQKRKLDDLNRRFEAVAYSQVQHTAHLSRESDLKLFFDLYQRQGQDSFVVHRVKVRHSYISSLPQG